MHSISSNHPMPLSLSYTNLRITSFAPLYSFLYHTFYILWHLAYVILIANSFFILFATVLPYSAIWTLMFSKFVSTINHFPVFKNQFTSVCVKSSFAWLKIQNSLVSATPYNFRSNMSNINKRHSTRNAQKQG